MKKFILSKTGEEVNIGDSIRGTKTIDTSFGIIKTIETIVISEDNIDSLIKRGIIKCINISAKKTSGIPTEKYEDDNIGFYIHKLAIRYKRNLEDVISWLNDTNKIHPKAVLDLLLQEIAMHFYNIDVEGFDAAETYYSLRPKDGKVGKVLNIRKYIPLFKSAEDAEKAREILKEQLEYMYGE